MIRITRPLHLLSAALIGLALAGAGCGGEDDLEPTAGRDETEQAGGGGGPSPTGTIEVELDDENDSGQEGTATLTAVGEEDTRLVIRLANSPGVPQPAHIHRGTCDSLEPTPAFPLENVTASGGASSAAGDDDSSDDDNGDDRDDGGPRGTSESMVAVALDELRSGTYAVNVHESADRTDVYVACGEIGDDDSDDADDGGSDGDDDDTDE